MSVLRLTKQIIESLQPTNKRVDYLDSSVKGLSLRVNPTGVKTYSLVYRRIDNKLRRYTIGRHGAIIVIPKYFHTV